MTAAVSLPTAEPRTAEQRLAEDRADLALGRRYQPAGDRVLLRRAPHVRSVGLIHIVGGKAAHMAVSRLIARGPAVKARTWELAPLDYVLHPRLSGVKIDVALKRTVGQSQDADLVLLHEEELICVVDESLVDSVEGEVVIPRDGSRELAKL